jgi:hypothetical protein
VTPEADLFFDVDLSTRLKKIRPFTHRFGATSPSHPARCTLHDS